ncbi:MAG TPA: hypothetical protein VEF33_11425, partial [Syntrophales bacterium]|nr:hypothetical protein [Syntrophales bacterium]
MDKKRTIRSLLVVWVILGLLLTSGCVTYATLPREKISEADKAVAEAKESNASVNAPGEMKSAEDK